MLDLLIKDGTVIDGSGAPRFKADLGIKGSTIELLEKLPDVSAERVIQATDKIVCPGFIDIHSHSDDHLLVNPRVESKIRQGVTTEVGGNCGDAAAPAAHWAWEEKRRLYREQFDRDLDFQSLSEYRRCLEKAAISVNYVPLIGFNTVRASVMGWENRPPSAAELKQMMGMIDQAMIEGAFGLSVGLPYPPACYAHLSELIAVSRNTVAWGGFLSCHIRDEGDQLLESLAEVITVARETGISLQISHLKAADRRNWQKLPQAFTLIEEARAEGLQITADRYPYLASQAGLQTLLPDRFFEGGLDNQLHRLQDPSCREWLQEVILEDHPDEEYWTRVVISQVTRPEHQVLTGLSVAEGALRTGKAPLEFIFDLLSEEKMQVEALFFVMSEDNLRKILVKPYVMIGSDSACRAHYGILSKGKPHPRAFGTFPRVLAHYVNRESLLTLEDAINKMTGAPAAKVGLKDRGKIAPGCKADLVVFDPREIADRATYQEPVSYPAGIDYVIVNGIITLEKGEHTGVGAGRILTKEK